MLYEVTNVQKETINHKDHRLAASVDFTPAVGFKVDQTDLYLFDLISTVYV